MSGVTRLFSLLVKLAASLCLVLRQVIWAFR